MPNEDNASITPALTATPTTDSKRKVVELARHEYDVISDPDHEAIEYVITGP